MGERAQIANVRVPPGGAPRRWMPTLAAGLSLGEYARSLFRRLAALTAVLLAAIWALDGQGYFWPAWAWLGLVVPVLLDFTAGWAWRHPRRRAPRRVRMGACQRRRGDSPADVVAHLAVGGRARVLACLGAARSGHGGQRLLADRPARPGAGRPWAAGAEGQDRPADPHAPPGRRRAGGRAAAHRARPARRRAGAVGRADAPAGPGRAARRRPRRGPAADPRCPARGPSRHRRAA